MKRIPLIALVLFGAACNASSTAPSSSSESNAPQVERNSKPTVEDERKSEPPVEVEAPAAPIVQEDDDSLDFGDPGSFDPKIGEGPNRLGSDELVGRGAGPPVKKVKTSIVSNDGHLKDSAIEAVLAALELNFGNCAGKGDLQRGATLQFEAKIGSTGTVTSATASDDGGHAKTATCMADTLKESKFPKPSKVNEVVFDVEIR